MKNLKSIYLIIVFLLVVSSSFSQYTKLLDFNGANGSGPYGSLISDGTFLYGMTSGVGFGIGLGNVFKIKTDGTNFTNMHSFSGANLGGTDGSYAYGSLIFDGTFLYGMTNAGGTSSNGTIFKIKTNSTGYTKLLDLNGINGSSPFGSFIFDGTYLYGMTCEGGLNNAVGGVLFKIKPDGTSDTVLFNFRPTSYVFPRGSLLYDGSYFYGMTTETYYSNGNSYPGGNIFKIKQDGTGYTNLLVFNDTNGLAPLGSLIFDGNFLYGTTMKGGTNNDGTMFKIKPDGSGYTNLLDFNGINGSSPRGDVIYDGTFLYGMTFSGGVYNYGTIFKIKPDGTEYNLLMNFDSVKNGSNPSGSLISDGTFLYGTTARGGSKNYGTIFRFNPYCSTVASTQSFTVCAGGNITVGAHTYNISGTYADTLRATSTCDSIVTTHLTVLPATTLQTFTLCAGQSKTVGVHTYTTTGTYMDTFTGVIVNGCDSTVSTHLTVLPVNTHTQSLTVIEGQGVNIGNHTYIDSGTYIDTLTSQVGCDSTVTTYLTIQPVIEPLTLSKQQFQFPNVFTPNNDNVNDIFQIKRNGIVSIRAEIYNRWGIKVAQWQEVNAGWDGRTFDTAQECPQGIYYYKVRYTDTSGTEKVENGYLELVR